MPDAGCRMPDAGCRMPDAWYLVSGIWAKSFESLSFSTTSQIDSD